MKMISLYDTETGELVREIETENPTEELIKKAEQFYSQYFGRPLFGEQS